jgi:hypothetical protein
MLTAKEFVQLVETLPRLEAFARERQLTSISMIKNPFNSKESDIYLCYTHEGVVHGLEVMAQIGQDFEKLWGVPLYEDILLAQDRAFYKGEIFDEHLKGSEFFLVSMDANQNYVIATAAQVADYAQHDFNLTIQPSNISDISDNPKKRRISDEKVTANETPSIASKNIFTQAPSQNSESNIDEQIEKLSLDECKQYLKSMTRQFGVNSLIEIRPVRKLD